MADASVQYLLEKIEALLEGELGLPKKVDTGITTLKGELESIKAFLNERHQRPNQDRQILVYARQIQDVAYDIDNVLDLFSYYQSEERRRKVFTRWRAMHSIEDEINNINLRLKDINETKERYQSTSSAFQASRTTHSDLHTRNAPLYLADADVVGFEEDKDMLIARALDMQDNHQIIFVVGMGGSGKTTLVKQVFEAVKDDFDCHAWISVSKTKKGWEILQNVLDQLRISSTDASSTSSQPSSIDSANLINTIKDSLKDKRYVIVLDDLWTHVWEAINFTFPGAISRIIITTRRGDIANSRKDRSIHVHNIPHLSLEKAEKLFHRNAFPSSQKCPPALDVLSNDILRKCEGLPLAIIEIGQFLSTKGESAPEWKKLHGSLASELKSSGRLSDIREVLILSYNDLPYHLKNCFLLMNIFPPNYPIQRRKLIQLWIAEGFIKEGDNGKELEDVGEEYLIELIQRSLIQVYEMDFDGRPRICRVHNIIHEIVLSELQDENFCEVNPKQSRININNKKIRRISIHNGDLGTFRSNLPARALLIFHSLAPCGHSIPISYSRLNMLRILHLEGANLDTFPAEIEELLLLRYLSLRNTRINTIPKSIRKFRDLETLDLKHTFVKILPKEISHLSNLRNLLVYRYDIEQYVTFNSVQGFEPEVAGEIKLLANLRKLSFVQVNKNYEVILSLQDLTKLRKLGIIGVRKEEGKILCKTIQGLSNLYSLDVTAESKNEVLDMHGILRPPPLQRLYLKGRLERMPSWISKLHDLVRLRLKWSRLDHRQNNPIEILQDLPNLLELQLFDAYDGNQLDFNAEKFPKLKILEFELLQQLNMVMLEKDTLPCLQTLIIRRCGQLWQIPVGIDNLSHLTEIHLYDMPQQFVSVLHKNGGSLYHLVRHIPLIRSYSAQSGGQWAINDLS